jgi:glucokinase
MSGRVALGIDIGGTKILAAVVETGTGAILSRARAATPADRGPAAVVDAAAGAAHVALAEADASVTVCGVGTAGTVDPRGVISSATDLLPGWAGTDVAGDLRRRLRLPVRVLNDGHATAMGEAELGAGRDGEDVLVVAVGTGIGAGFVHGGHLVAGPRGSFASVGHVLADPRGPRCSCGASGHLEAMASGPALEAAYRRLAGAGRPLVEVQSLAESGDERARRVFDEGGAVLGRTLAGAVSLLDADSVVIGGGVGQAGELLLAPLRASLAEAMGDRNRPVRVDSARLGADACVIGAALWAVRRRVSQSVHSPSSRSA